MAHELDITDGRTAFVTANTDAWHRLGATLDHSFTAEEAMREGLLGGWNVRKVPLLAGAGDNQLVIPGMNAVVRDNPVRPGRVDVLSRYGVSDGYQIIQNEEHAGLLDALVDESGAHFETAGSLRGGRQVFITMKLPGHIRVGGVDSVDSYIAAVNSHDGSLPFTLMVTPVRVVCANTLNCAFRDHSHAFRVRHTSRAGAAIRTQARAALDMTFEYLEGFQAEAERLIDTTLTQARFEEIVAAEFGAPEGAPAATATRAENKLNEMSELFADSMTQAGVRETAWAGFNALTEWADHLAPVRGDDRDATRATRALLDPSFKDRALRLMQTV